jgi:hypothetical protein
LRPAPVIRHPPRIPIQKFRQIKSGALLSCAATARGRGIKRLVHDPANGAGATATLGAATEATINLSGRARRRFGLAGAANILVAQYVAGADDHAAQNGPGRNFRYFTASRQAKEKRSI